MKTNDRDQFLGDFSVVDNGIVRPNTPEAPSFVLNYETSILINNSDTSSIQISNFFDIMDGGAQVTDVVIATIEGDNLTITPQVIWGITFQGSGTISTNGQITISWTAFESANANWEGKAVYTLK